MDYYPLNKIFTQKDLYWLDQLMPGSKKKAKDALQTNQSKGNKSILNCCGVRQRGRYNVEETNDADVAPKNPDIVLKLEEGDTNNKSANGRPDSLEATLEPLLENGSSSKID